MIERPCRCPLPQGPCRMVAVRSCMPASTQGVQPIPHASLVRNPCAPAPLQPPSLPFPPHPAGPSASVRSSPSPHSPRTHTLQGVDAYVQMTSPIRRYADLVAHYQLKAHLRGEPPPLSDSQVLRRAEVAQAMAREAQRVSRLSERYWVTHWFATRGSGEGFPALVLRALRGDNGASGLYSVLLEGTGLEVVTKLGRDCWPGERVLLEVQAARPRDGVLFFRERPGGVPPECWGGGGNRSGSSAALAR